jgi:surface protein
MGRFGKGKRGGGSQRVEGPGENAEMASDDHGADHTKHERTGKTASENSDTKVDLTKVDHLQAVHMLAQLAAKSGGESCKLLSGGLKWFAGRQPACWHAAPLHADLLKPILDERQREQAAAQGPAFGSKDAATHNTLGESDTQTRSAGTADKDNSNERQAVAIDVSPTAPQGGGKTDAEAPNRRRRYCLIGAVLILVAATAVVVGVFASGSNNTSKTTVTFANKTALKSAVKAWCAGDTATYGDIANWDVSRVTDMSYLFCNNDGTSVVSLCSDPVQRNCSPNISKWNTASVTDMGRMFFGAHAFNQAIGNWNTAAVTNMGDMFMYATAFNQPIGNWNTAAVHSMTGMFYATAFDQDIGNWDTAKVTTMSGMFSGAGLFNQPICNWNTAKVTGMEAMFLDAFAFNQAIGNWNTAAVTSMWGMFMGATAFNQKLCWPHEGVYTGDMWTGSKVGDWGTGTPANCT